MSVNSTSKPSVSVSAEGFKTANSRWLQIVLRFVAIGGSFIGAVLVLTQYTGFPQITPITQLISFYLLLALGWIPVAIVSWFAHLRVLTALSIVLAISMVMTPIFSTTTPSVSDAGSSQPVVIGSGNIQGSPEATRTFLEEAVTREVDVAFIVECNRSCAKQVETRSDEFPHQLIQPEEGPSGAAIISKFPLTDIPKKQIPKRFSQLLMPQTRIDINGTIVYAKLAHPYPPLPLSLSRWSADLEQLAEFASKSQEHPNIIAGDFNATHYHRPFREILASGDLTDTLSAADGTWPSSFPQWATAGIDHILVSSEFGLEESVVVDIPGTDHRAVFTQTQLASL